MEAAVNDHVCCNLTGKRMHPSRSRAKRHLKRLKRASNYRGSCYVCLGCGSWHVGHYRSQERVRRKCDTN
jgi:hypothetical protein